jgi:hypothetical protein
MFMLFEGSTSSKVHHTSHFNTTNQPTLRGPTNNRHNNISIVELNYFGVGLVMHANYKLFT